MTEQEEYLQYLRETGQIPGVSPELSREPARKPLATLGDVIEFSNQRASPENIRASAEGALALQSGGLTKAIPALGRGIGRIVAPYLEGGALGAAQAPEGDRLAGFLKGAALQGGLDTAGRALSKVGDVAMQVAANRKKYTPGVGSRLADEGLWGTEGMLKRQTQAALGRRGQEMQQIAEQIPGAPISARQAAADITEEMSAPILGRGRISSQQVSQADIPDLNAMRSFAEDVASRGDETVSQALARRSAAGHRAWRGKENPSQSLTGKLSKSEQKAYSQQLKKADPTGRLAEADAAYSALARAKTGLEQEASLPRSAMGVLSLGANQLPGGSLAASTIGQATSKGGKLAQFLAPLARQAAVGGVRDPGPSAEELAEYEQYLRETGQK